MRLSITGTTGFVGSNIVPYLSQRGMKISALSLRQPLSAASLANTDAVIHLAGKAHDLRRTGAAQDYYAVNFELTRQLFDAFLESAAETFIFVSSVKAAADHPGNTVLNEEYEALPLTDYGKSKRMAEQYILGTSLPKGKKVYILRPCMIHGPGNKGNLNLLFKLVSKGVPWILGGFENKRSFLTVENLCFVIHELLLRGNIQAGIFQVADSEPLSTNELIRIIAGVLHKKPVIWSIPKAFVVNLAKMGDRIPLPLNSERLAKLTENYEVSNRKLITALGKPLPVTAAEGIATTIRSFGTI
jgi:nucleoside-diphosphate-sugar epimerase